MIGRQPHGLAASLSETAHHGKKVAVMIGVQDTVHGFAVRISAGGEDPLEAARRYLKSHLGFLGSLEVSSHTDSGLPVLTRFAVTAQGLRYTFAEVG